MAVRRAVAALLLSLSLATPGCRPGAERGSEPPSAAETGPGRPGSGEAPAAEREAPELPGGSAGEAPGGSGAGEGRGAAHGGSSSGDLAAESADSPAAATAVVRGYYRDLAAGDYHGAYGRWGNEGRASGRGFEDFRRGYAETAEISAEVGPPGRVEGAAGSRYTEVPVTVRAATTAGERQCFRGVYTLRRTVVTGATAAQRRWHFASAYLRPCGEGGTPPAAVSALVEQLGERLSKVCLLGPAGSVEAAMREHYAPLVTADLLDRWLRDPENAPGRTTSSPWPERIEVGAAWPLAADAWRVDGEVVWRTSVEAARGGAASRTPVSLTVRRSGEGWRIADYRELR